VIFASMGLWVWLPLNPQLTSVFNRGYPNYGLCMPFVAVSLAVNEMNDTESVSYAQQTWHLLAIFYLQYYTAT